MYKKDYIKTLSKIFSISGKTLPFFRICKERLIEFLWKWAAFTVIEVSQILCRIFQGMNFIEAYVYFFFLNQIPRQLCFAKFGANARWRSLNHLMKKKRLLFPWDYQKRKEDLYCPTISHSIHCKSFKTIKRAFSKSSFHLQTTTSVRERPQRSTWALLMWPTLLATAVCSQML